MTVTATSSAAIAVQSLIDLVAASDTFQDRLEDYHGYEHGTMNSSIAKQHIYAFDQFSETEGSKDARPFAVVGLMQHLYEANVMCGQLNHQTSGTLFLVLVDNARHTDTEGDPATDGYNDSYIDALNFFGGVLDDLTGAALASSPFPPLRFETVVEPTRPDIHHRQTDDFWLVVYSANFGNEGGGPG
jgi:hypothetical protein